MTSELPLRCTCGTLRGRARGVGRRRSNRLACYCKDCQAFAHFLGRARELLDAHGGTEIVQLPPARVELTQGSEQLACMRLSPRGLMRWYAKCCNTPLANTLPKANMPFCGLISACWDPALDAEARDALLGPLRARVNGPGHRDAEGKLAEIDTFPLGTILHSIRVLAGGWIRGEHQPSPFFDYDQPRAQPRVLDEAELAELKAGLASA
jgi:hypothetical protein